MFELKYKCRNNSNPKGKPRVYFCSHPGDFSYFDNFSTAILKKYDVVVYYNTYTSNDIDDLLLQLEQLQLIIVPITKKFLTEPNIALDIEFKYAVEKHIPILPILLESDLVELYREKCGNTQFLDVVCEDETTISYEKKADELFQAVILNETDIARIRNEFDAYIFLSYRKKDRIHSQKLMKLIHENDDLRDVAIWYDEFLLPGDDFKDEIVLALSKSDLFMLLVTPNLVNEENYVMNIEYPYAKSINKPIIAVEAVKTKATELKRFYTEIPKRIKSVDASLLIEKIFSKIDKISLVKEETPEHTYLIGLAYLKGVDVEVNVEKGLEMIFDAAKRGCYDALKETIKIYSNGIGVEKNIEKVIFWREKLMEYFEEKLPLILENHPSGSQEYNKFFKDYFLEKLKYADSYGEYFDAEKCDKLLFECEELISHFRSNDSLYYEALMVLEKVHILNLNRTDRTNESLKHYEKLLSTFKYLDMTDKSIMLSYINNKIEYAKALRLLNNFDESISIYKEILDEYNFNDVINNLEIDDAYKNWSTLYLELAVSSFLTNDPNNALLTENSLNECLSLSKKYLLDAPSKASLKMLVDNYIDVLQFDDVFQKYDKEIKKIDDCLNIIDEIYDEDLLETCMHLKSKLYNKKALISKKQGDFQSQKLYTNKSIELLNFNYDELSDNQKINLIFKIANIYGEQGFINEQLNILSQAFDLDLKSSYVLEINLNYEISQVYSNLTDYHNALKYILKAYEKLDIIKDTNKNFYYDMLVKCFGDIILFNSKLDNDYIKTFNKYSYLIDTFLEIPLDSPFFYNRIMIDMIFYYSCTKKWVSSTFDEAEELLLFCLKGYERIQDVCIGNYHDEIAMVYLELYDYYLKKKDYLNAKKMMDAGFVVTSDNETLYSYRLRLYKSRIKYYINNNSAKKAKEVYDIVKKEVKDSVKELYNIEIEELTSEIHYEYLYNYLQLINTWTSYLIENKKYEEALQELKLVLKFIDYLRENTNSHYQLEEISAFYMYVGKCLLKLNNKNLSDEFFNNALNILYKLEQTEFVVDKIRYIKRCML